MASSVPSNVEITEEEVEIDLANNRVANSDPAPANLFNSGAGAPIHDADEPLQHGRVSNEYAANLLLRRNLQFREEFRGYLQQYHEACVKVISGHERGSGILFKTSDTSIMLVTAAHIIEDKNNVTILLEKDYKDRGRDDKVGATKVKIQLQNQSTTIEKGADIATLALADDVSRSIIERVREFPLASLVLDDHSSEEFMMIHYGNDDFKRVSTGEREGTPGSSQPLQTRIHIQAGEGASGAPLFNFQGHVVAILTSHDENYTMLGNFLRLSNTAVFPRLPRAVNNP